jgi:hypothetical protein
MKAPEFTAALDKFVTDHDRRVHHCQWEKGAIYEKRSPRPKKGGGLYVFSLVGPEGTGYYRCWCNDYRGARVPQEAK